MPALNEGFVYRSRVTSNESGQGLLAHLLRFTHSNEAEWREHVQAGRVTVEGRVAGVDTLLQSGEVVEYHRPPWVEEDVPTDYEVVHETSELLVINKPSGLQVLPGGRFVERTLLSLVQRSAPSAERWAPVHRLGRGTSGLVLFGKTPQALAELSQRFRRREVRKLYLARVVGTELPDSLALRTPIAPMRHGDTTVHAAATEGLDSLTLVRVLQRDAGRGESLVAAMPVTGRPHQIRIHLAAAQAPLKGDPLFEPGGRACATAAASDVGYHLHATRLNLVGPDARRLRLSCPPPSGWTRSHSAPGS